MTSTELSGANVRMVSATPAAASYFDISPAASAFLDFMRALAAFLVVIGHARQFAFGDLPLFWPLSVLTGSGAQAVVIFFVLSGFLVGREACLVWLCDEKTATRYAVDRATRIYVVLVPALVATAIWDGFTGPRMSWQIFFGNLLALQDFFVPPFGSDGPLWSLSYEMWCYALFPLMLIAIRHRRRPRVAVPAAICLCIASGTLGIVFIKNAIFWLFGAAAWLPHRSRFRPSIAAMTLAAVLLVPDLAQLNASGIGYLRFTGIAAATAALVVAFRFKPAVIGWLKPAFSTLAAFSFTLYVFHFPMMLRVSGYAQQSTAAAKVAEFFVLIALAYLYSYLAFLLFERNYRFLRSIIAGRHASIAVPNSPGETSRIG